MSFGSPDWTGTDRIAVLRFSPDGRYLEQIGEGTGLVRKQFEGNRKAPTAFSPYPYFAVRGESVFHIRGGSPTVQVWSPDAVRELTFPVVEHDVETAWTDLHDSLERANAEYFLALYPHASMPEAAPQLAGLLVDVDGRVWTKRYDPSRDSFWLGNGGRAAGGTWRVADAERRVLATAQMPASFSPFQVLADRVVGVGVDSLGVQRVEVRRLSIPN